MKIERIDPRALPGQNPLFLAYHFEKELVRPFFQFFSSDTEFLKRRLDHVLGTPRLSRKILVPPLRVFNQRSGAGEVTLKNLEALESEDTVVVATGQQVGLFGGPSYSIYKAVTAIKLVMDLRAKGISAVPIFWLAADDSDFEEIRSTFFFDSDGQPVELKHFDPRKREQQMAGTAPLSAAPALLEELEISQRGRWASNPILAVLRDCFQPERSFSEAFAAWLSWLFRDYGLIVFDPTIPDYRYHLGGFFRKAIERRQDILASLTERNRSLRAAGFPVQVAVEPNETLLFWVDGNSRFKLEYRDGRYQAKGRRTLRFTASELLKQTETLPVPLGANVLLRPVLQDYLFPSFAGIAGPSEVAYFAQVSAVSPFWGLETISIPRSAFTLIDRKAQRLLKKNGLQVLDVLNSDLAQLTERVLRVRNAGETLRHIDKMKAECEANLDELNRLVKCIDPSVAEMLDRSRRKIEYQLGRIKNRFVQNQRESDTHLKRQIQYLRSHLVPANHLQERVINFNHFLAAEGHDFIHELIECVEPFDSGHSFVYL